MQIIELPWEKKNLGINCVEIRISEKDNCDEIRKAISETIQYDYLTCKIPANNMEQTYYLQENGFLFSETAFELTANLANVGLDPLHEKYVRYLSYHKAALKENELIFSKIREGIFDTDRIALDPRFSLSLSGNRYANWCEDEFTKGNVENFIVERDNNSIGFFSLRISDDPVTDSFLAGLFDNKNDGGFGFSVLYFPMEHSRKLGKKKITTRVSSNNVESVKVHLALGYQIKKMLYVFVKHNR